jgi:hypothetical protein
VKILPVVLTIASLSHFLLACAETGQERTSVPLLLAGTDVSAGITAVGDVPVTLVRADLAFGPLYLCSGFQAGDLCDTARLEWLDSAVIDTTRAEPIEVGALVGVTGPVRSWMFDLGLSSQLTQPEPVVLDAAQELGGASVVLEGSADVNGVVVPFHAAVPVQQVDETELGVPVIRKSTSDTFSHDVSPNDEGLVIRFNPALWIEGVDFRTFVSTATCTGENRIVCAGFVEQTCNIDGGVASSRDCAALEQACWGGQGCSEQLEIEPESAAFRSIRNAVVSGERPAFEWQ